MKIRFICSVVKIMPNCLLQLGQRFYVHSRMNRVGEFLWISACYAGKTSFLGKPFFLKWKELNISRLSLVQVRFSNRMHIYILSNSILVYSKSCVQV